MERARTSNIMNAARNATSIGSWLLSESKLTENDSRRESRVGSLKGGLARPVPTYAKRNKERTRQRETHFVDLFLNSRFKSFSAPMHLFGMGMQPTLCPLVVGSIPIIPLESERLKKCALLFFLSSFIVQVNLQHFAKYVELTIEIWTA